MHSAVVFAGIFSGLGILYLNNIVMIRCVKSANAVYFFFVG